MLKNKGNIDLKGFAVCLLLVAICSTAYGQELRYVNDQLKINFRSGAGGEYRILATLRSGRAMELLEEKGDFAHVRLENGKEGWVRRQYLSKRPVARQLLAEANKQLSQLKAEQVKASAELKQLRSDNKQLSQRLGELEQERGQIAQENSTLQSLAARPMEIDQKNQQLSAENTALLESMERLNQDNEALRDSTVQKWFVAGGSVLFAGIVLGFVLPKMGRRKKSTW